MIAATFSARVFISILSLVTSYTRVTLFSNASNLAFISLRRDDICFSTLSIRRSRLSIRPFTALNSPATSLNFPTTSPRKAFSSLSIELSLGSRSRSIQPGIFSAIQSTFRDECSYVI